MTLMKNYSEWKSIGYSSVSNMNICRFAKTYTCMETCIPLRGRSKREVLAVRCLDNSTYQPSQNIGSRENQVRRGSQ